MKAVSSSQQRYATPEAAVEALRAACESNDSAALVAIFGPDAADVIDSGDAALDRAAREKFADLIQQKMRLAPRSQNEMELIVGANNWPFPVLLVHEKEGWRWDTEEGADEILNRRIGRDELAAIEICRAYVAAQAAYSWRDRDGDQVLEYAQRVVSTPGTHDGLYWERRSVDDPPSPLDMLAAITQELFPDRKEGDPLMGYRFRILTRQGENVPGGKYDYVINGNMIAGFALVAWPADYGNSGIMTFVVNHQGRVLQKDLGEQTGSICAKMKSYNPDQSWIEVQ